VYNNKLELLTSKMREIAEKAHFSSVEESIKKEKSKRNVCKTSEDTHVNTMDLINRKNQLHESARL
jgi:tRNA A37 threonylcarbamoyladenosine dehydratase